VKAEYKTPCLLLRRFRESDYDDLFEFLSQLADDEFEGYPGITRDTCVYAILEGDGASGKETRI
jgi:hypothetical protein